jgi:LacI family transcriptional regulator
VREVARAANVSVSTVTNVLNYPSRVAAPTRRRVEQAMLEVGYVRSGPARQLRGLPSRIVGSVTLDQANPFYAVLNRAIEDRLDDEGCMLLACSTDMRVDREQRVLQMLEEQSVRGILITPISGEFSELATISRRGTPIVIIDSRRGALDVCSAGVDHVIGGRLVGEHLLGLGHRRIALVSYEVQVGPVADRLAGLGQALAAEQMDPAKALLDVRMPNDEIHNIAGAAVDAILDSEDVPTAVACANDVCAVNIVRALQRRGVQVPEDMSVTGYDDLPLAADMQPSLTTVKRPVQALGRAAVELLLAEGSEDHLHREVLFRPSLVVRQSTAEPARRSRP